jgi:hypothetical protein
MLFKKLLGATVSPTTLEYVGDDNSYNSDTLYLDSSIFDAGDLVFFFDSKALAFATPAKVVPSGWTELTTMANYAGFGGVRSTVCYKIIDNGDLDENVGGMTGGSWKNKVLFGFRSNRTISSVSFEETYATAQQSDPSEQYIDAYTDYPYAIISGFHGPESSVDYDRTWFDDSIEHPNGSDGSVRTAYNLFSSGGSAETVDVDTTAGGSSHVCFWVSVMFPSFS